MSPSSFFPRSVLDFSPSPSSFLSVALMYWSLSTRPGSRLHPSSRSGFFLHSASLDSPRITWEKELLCLLLRFIIAPATPTTGFICWRRMTSDTSALQAGLPLSPARALFLVAEGAERVFNEIQTLGVRSRRLLKTWLPLTSVTNVRRSKTQQNNKNRKPWAEPYRRMLLCYVNVQWLWETGWGSGRGGGLRFKPRLFEGLNPPLSAAAPFSSLIINNDNKHTVRWKS